MLLSVCLGARAYPITMVEQFADDVLGDEARGPSDEHGGHRLPTVGSYVSALLPLMTSAGVPAALEIPVIPARP